jgi:hypothetical protein
MSRFRLEIRIMCRGPIWGRPWWKLSRRRHRRRCIVLLNLLRRAWATWRRPLPVVHTLINHPDSRPANPTSSPYLRSLLWLAKKTHNKFLSSRDWGEGIGPVSKRKTWSSLRRKHRTSSRSRTRPSNCWEPQPLGREDRRNVGQQFRLKKTTVT